MVFRKKGSEWVIVGFAGPSSTKAFMLWWYKNGTRRMAKTEYGGGKGSAVFLRSGTFALLDEEEEI